MHTFTTLAELRRWRQQAGFVAFVPTMGNLHQGHVALCQRAKAEAAAHGGQVICSIFVNPIQFGPGEDLDSYPRTLAADSEKLAAADVDALFHPSIETLYPHGAQQYFVEPPAIQTLHCGAFRPGHFRGVATVVAKLFHLVQPDCAVFGKKDYQQLAVIRGMVRDLNMPVQIVGVETERAADGLALSSRNGYLSAAERAEAPRLRQTLLALQTAMQQGRRDYAALEQQAAAELNAHGWQTDYIRVVNRVQLLPPAPDARELVILVAARLGKARLIDNLEVLLAG